MFVTRLSSYVRCVAACCLATAVAWGASVDFTATSGDWSTAANWSPAVVPGIADDVTIGAGKMVNVAANADIYANSIVIAGAGSLSLTTGGDADYSELTIGTNLTVNGGMTVGGPLNGVGAKLVFNSSAPQLTGTGTLTFGTSAATGGTNGIIVPDGASVVIGGALTVSGTSWGIDQATPADGTVLSAIFTLQSLATLNIPSGTLNLKNGINLTNSGTLILGSGANLVYDSNLFSNFTQTANPSRLSWTINNSGLSAILSPNSVNLSGTLSLNRPATIFPSLGDTAILFSNAGSNAVGDFTTITGPAAGDYTKSFSTPFRTCEFTFDLELQTITWGQTFGTVLINTPAINLTATSDGNSAVEYVTYTIAKVGSGTLSASIINSTGTGVRAKLQPGSVGETVRITAHATRVSTYDDAKPVSKDVTIGSPASVTITTPGGGFTYGDTLAASADSGGAITWTTTNSSVVDITNSGSTAKVIGVGTATVTATAAANGLYVVGSATIALGTINPKSAVVTVGSQTRNYGQANPTNTFSVIGLIAGDTNASLGSPTYSGTGVTANLTTAAGDYPINVSFPTVNYSLTSGPQAYLSIIALQSQTITFGTQSSLMAGASRTLPATSSAGLTVIYVSSNPAVATISGNVVTAVAAGTTNITASQAGNATYAAATSVIQPLAVTALLTQSITFGAQASLMVGSTRTLPATSSAGLTITYISSNPAVAAISGGNIVTGVAAGSVDITATQAGDATYAFAPSVTQTVVITAKLAQTITYVINGGAPTSVEVGQGLTLTAFSTSGLAISYTSSDPALATMAGDRFTAVAPGSVTVTASQAGDATYNAATSIARTITVIPAGTGGTTANATSSEGGGGCGVGGGGVALILGMLALGWRRRN